MITRAQAEALLTLAESLEACERAGATFSTGPGVSWLNVPGESCALEDGLTGTTLRSYVASRLPKPIGS